MRRIATVCVAAAILALPATASAETIKQQGGIVGDDVAKVSLKIEVSGAALSVVDFKAEDVFTRCDKKPSRIDFTALSAIEVKLDGTFKDRLKDDAGGVLRIAGKIKDDGNATVGTLKTNEIESDDGTICKTPKQKFKTFAAAK